MHAEQREKTHNTALLLTAAVITTSLYDINGP